MSKSTTSSVFPDVNVWLALSSPDHEHFHSAWNWYATLPDATVLSFCRFTQLGLLRLLTTRAAMGAGTLTQAEAWDAYDFWLENGGAGFTNEPEGIEPHFRSRANTPQASPKDWADSYLAAFSLAAGSTLVTFDRALAGKARGAVLLG
jgi:uncharacterized protein